MEYEQGIAALQRRTKISVALCWAFMAVTLLAAAGQLLEAFGIVNVEFDDTPLALATGLLYLLYAVAFWGSALALAFWIYRAHANLHEIGLGELQFSPGWAVGWYFIPIANLFKPFQAMRELWTRSHGEPDSYGAPAPTEITIWWTFWLAGNILSSIGGRIAETDGEFGFTTGSIIGAVSSVCLAAAAFHLVRIMKSVLEAQLSGGTAVEVFA